jgi:uncharacterized protein (TIGR00369 family)
MDDQEKQKLLGINKPPSLDSMNFRSVDFDSSREIAVLEFEAIPEFCHSESQIVQGGFVTGMMDASMALLLIGVLDFKFNPVSLDINVSFLEPAHPGLLFAKAKILRLGKSIAYMSSTLTQDGTLVATSTSTVKLIPINKKAL